MKEKAVQTNIKRFLTQLGVEVMDMSQPRASMMPVARQKRPTKTPMFSYLKATTKRPDRDAANVSTGPDHTNLSRRLRMATDKVSTPEVWRAIQGFEGWYEVSSHGRVRSLDRVVEDARGRQQNRKAHLLTPKKIGFRNGVARYRCVRLCMAGDETHAMVHVLVAQAFLGHDPASDLEVNHKDGDGTNNRLDNLEVVTREKNARHAVRTGLRPSHIDKVPAIREALRAGQKSQRVIAADFGVSQSFVSRIGSGKRLGYVK